MGTLSKLLRWNKDITLKDEKGNDLKKVWLRVISDYDLQEAYKIARIASAAKRARLRDVDSNDFKDEVMAFQEATADECKGLIRASRENAWTSQAFSAVVRPDEIKLSEIAVDPDAPTLEEQEKHDILNKEVDDKYQKEIQDYVDQKKIELEADLNNLELSDLQLLAQTEATVLLPLTAFMNELIDQKTWRSVYEDKEFQIRGFDSVEDFRETREILRNQLTQAYTELEAGLDEVKN